MGLEPIRAPGLLLFPRILHAAKTDPNGPASVFRFAAIFSRCDAGSMDALPSALEQAMRLFSSKPAHTAASFFHPASAAAGLRFSQNGKLYFSLPPAEARSRFMLRAFFHSPASKAGQNASAAAGLRFSQNGKLYFGLPFPCPNLEALHAPDLFSFARVQSRAKCIRCRRAAGLWLCAPGALWQNAGAAHPCRGIFLLPGGKFFCLPPPPSS